MMVRCPGQDQRFWQPDDIFEVKCPQCGLPKEFFKDEPQLTCRHCGKTIVNPKIDLGCAEWCQYASQCLGVTVNNLIVIREKLIGDMKAVFGQDEKRIDHALAVLAYAEQLQAVEGGDPLVIKAAAILHDIGIHQAEQKHGSSAGIYQEIEGPPIAAEILRGHGIDTAVMEHVLKIIANHHSAKDIDTLEFRVIWDADWLVNMQADRATVSQEDRAQRINRIFKTPTGKQLAQDHFLTKGS